MQWIVVGAEGAVRSAVLSSQWQTSYIRTFILMRKPVIRLDSSAALVP